MSRQPAVDDRIRRTAAFRRRTWVGRFCAELEAQAAELRRGQRHLDRQQRANNLDNYLPDGRVKKGLKGRKALAGVAAASSAGACVACRGDPSVVHR